MLKEVYGDVILKKDIIVYHTSEECFNYKGEEEKSMLFCTFHPSEYGMIGDNVTTVKLKRDVSLFFMIEDIKKARIQDALEKNIIGIFFKVLDNAIAGDVEAARLVFELYGLADRISVSEPDVKVD